jgi:hypothetical protein
VGSFRGVKIRSVGCFWTASFQSKTARKIRFESVLVFVPIEQIYAWLAASFFTLETSVFEADFSCSELFIVCLGSISMLASDGSIGSGRFEGRG